METSRAMNRCIGQVLRNSKRCRYNLHSNRQISLHNQHNAATLSQGTCRAFSTSNSHAKDEANVPKPESSSNSTATTAASTKNATSQSQSRTRLDRPRRQSRDAGRIDLSTIPGMPSNYRPPNRPDEATAQAKLRSLLGAVAPPSSSSSSRGGDPNNSGGNETNNFPRSNLDAYTNAQIGRRPSPTFDLASLIEDLDRPRRGGGSGNNASGSFLSESDESGEVLRLRPTLGRTVNVTPATGFDLTRAFRTLEIRCNANNVKRDEIKQRFHVRRGQQRKLDRRTRWRALFKDGFLAECARVRRMRAQGW